MLEDRQLTFDEIDRIWSIDRSETISGIYTVEDGALRLVPKERELPGWRADIPHKYGPILEDCHARGGWFQGAFDGDKLVAVAVLDNAPLGPQDEQLQLKCLFISRAYRGQGLGQRLFEAACEQARCWGAQQLYVSSTPTESTVRFYLARGCYLNPQPDPTLYALEPQDIHLLCDL